MPMKKGSGNLDFGEDDADSDDEPHRDDSEPRTEASGEEGPTDRRNTEQTPTRPESTESEPESDDEPEYPYFVRRSKVGDERDERIEVHLRTEVSDQESAFRSDLADVLETGEVSKTDAREFALKFAFENPEGVAELMREEGYGITD